MTYRLSATQRAALTLIYERRETAAARGLPAPWLGAREGVQPNTLDALERRELVTVKTYCDPYPRRVGRLTKAGIIEGGRR